MPIKAKRKNEKRAFIVQLLFLKMETLLAICFTLIFMSDIGLIFWFIIMGCSGMGL
jgi:hypothetical protein